MSNIEWTDRTWNPTVGCTPVSPGCLNCYAARMAVRLEGMGKAGYESRDGVRIAEVKGDRPVFTGEVRLMEDRLSHPLKWRKPSMVFVDSMSDLFHESVPFDFIDRVFAVMALCPQHVFQVLTKRPERMAQYLTDGETNRRTNEVAERIAEITRGNVAAWLDLKVHQIGDGGLVWPLPNVWLGTSAEDQARLSERVPHLLRCPASVRFISAEPLLGALDFRQWLTLCKSSLIASDEQMEAALEDGRFGNLDAWALHWVIVGGESGPRARPCNVAWIRSVVEQCRGAGVACFVKQLGRYAHDEDSSCQTAAQSGPFLERLSIRDPKGGDPAEWPEDLRVREMPHCITGGALDA